MCFYAHFFYAPSTMVYTNDRNTKEKVHTLEKKFNHLLGGNTMQGFFGRGDCGCGNMGGDSCWIILLLLLCGGCGSMNQTVDICTLILLLVILGKDNGCGKINC